MATISEALDGLRAVTAPLCTTGLQQLDHLLGGMRPGDVWLVTSPPRHGRSSWCAQLASRAASHDVPTTVLVGVDGVGPTAAKVLSAGTRIPQHWLHDGRALTGPAELERLERARTWPLHLFSQGDTSLTHTMTAAASRSMIVIDDLDRWSDDPLGAVEDLKAWALNSGGAVLVTVPQGIAGEATSSWQRCVRAVDVIIDLDQQFGDRLGEINLKVRHNRRGPLATITAAAIFHYSSLLDLDAYAPHPDAAMSGRIPVVESPAWGSADDWTLPQESR